MADLTDAEIVAACARAMGTEIHEVDDVVWCDFRGVGLQLYHPIQNDAQAMALVKQLGMSIEYDDEMKTWFASQWSAGDVCIEDDSLNRAICLCAARVQIEKEKNA